MKNPKIFVLEDDDWFNRLLVHCLELNPDHSVLSFKNAQEMYDALAKIKPEVMTLDYRLPDASGEDVLKKVKEVSPETEVIIISEQEDIQTAVSLLKLGAFDYMVKTKDIRDRLIHTIDQVKKQAGLKRKIERLETEVEKKYDFTESLVGESPQLKKTFKLIEKAIQTPITVSISGETGTGKEVVAKAIHYHSDRKKKPFVAVNMGAIPKDLVESELFGHEKGAFTGANARRLGKFEEADGGTLFLDEIGELDPNFQVKLLRVLQEKEVTRVGSNKPVKVDCRIIVATNRDLKEEVKKGNFREDLFYRIFGIPIQMPPLRERGNDVLILSKFFIQNFAETHGLEPKGLASSAKTKLMGHAWPGNVRELKSVIELAAVMASSDQIEADDITLATDNVLPSVIGEEMSLREYNQRIVNIYMDKFENDTKRVADALSIGQTTVYRLLKEQKEQKV